MAKTLVLTNLDSAVTETMIRNFLFDQGKINSIKIIPPRDRQHGFAYVEMALDNDSARVMRSLNHHELLGQPVFISRVT